MIRRRGREEAEDRKREGRGRRMRRRVKGYEEM